MEALVITLREGIEAALVVGIILAYLQKSGRNALRPYVIYGAAVAALASVLAAMAFKSMDIEPEGAIEGVTMAVAAVFVASMVIWMWSAGRNVRRSVQAKLDSVMGPQAAQATTHAAAAGLFGLTFIMVLREGIETVLFLAATTVSEGRATQLAGGLIGLALAVSFAVLLTKDAVRINVSRFFAVTSVILLVLAVKLVAGSVHAFAEDGLLPMGKSAMAALGYASSEATSTYILIALLAGLMTLLLPGALARSETSRRTPGSSDQVSPSKPAITRRQRLGSLGMSVVLLAIMLVMGFSVVRSGPQADPKPTSRAPEALSTIMER